MKNILQKRSPPTLVTNYDVSGSTQVYSFRVRVQRGTFSWTGGEGHKTKVGDVHLHLSPSAPYTWTRSWLVGSSFESNKKSMVCIEERWSLFGSVRHVLCRKHEWSYYQPFLGVSCNLEIICGGLYVLNSWMVGQLNISLNIIHTILE